MRVKNIKLLLKALASSVLILILLILIIFRISNNLSKSFDDVERTYQIISNFEAIENEIYKAESSVRTYFISRNPLLEEDIHISLLETRQILEHTRKLIASESIQDKFSVLSDKILQKEQCIYHNLKLAKDNEALSPTEILLPIQEDIRISHSIDSLFNDIKKDESQLLLKRKNRSSNALRFTMWSLSIVGLFSIALGVIAITSFRKDITQRKKTEKELRKLDENKNKFFTIVSHDLKGPIRGMVALTEMLDHDSKINSSQQQNIIHHLNLSAQNLYKLVENLLNWARIQMNKVEFEPVRFKLNDVVQEAIDQAKLQFEEKNIRIEKSLNEEFWVFADKNMIITVLRNLISNSIKFSNTGGAVIIESNIKNNSFLEVSVADNGVGIGPEALEKLFNIGQYYSSSGTAGEQGTGLGLLICKEFIEKNKGTIRVNSSKTKGTTFIFTIPMAKQQNG